jgi:hypothetical protein
MLAVKQQRYSDLALILALEANLLAVRGEVSRDEIIRALDRSMQYNVSMFSTLPGLNSKQLNRLASHSAVTLYNLGWTEAASAKLLTHVASMHSDGLLFASLGYLLAQRGLTAAAIESYLSVRAMPLSNFHYHTSLIELQLLKGNVTAAAAHVRMLMLADELRHGRRSANGGGNGGSAASIGSEGRKPQYVHHDERREGRGASLVAHRPMLLAARQALRHAAAEAAGSVVPVSVKQRIRIAVCPPPTPTNPSTPFPLPLFCRSDPAFTPSFFVVSFFLISSSDGFGPPWCA